MTENFSPSNIMWQPLDNSPLWLFFFDLMLVIGDPDDNTDYIDMLSCAYRML